MSVAVTVAGVLWLPAASDATTEICWPLVCAGVNVATKLPLPSVVVRPIMVPSLLVMTMLLFGSAVPVICVPAGLSVMSGVSGGVVSTMKLIGCDNPLWFPAASVTCTVIE